SSQPLFDFVHPDDLNETLKVWSVLKQGESIQAFENRYRCQDGGYRWFSWNAYPLLEQGQIYSIARDITERKKNELALKNAHERLITILDSIESLVYVADMNSYELLYVNKYGRDIFGEVVGKQCWKALQKSTKIPCVLCTNPKLLNQEGKPTGVYTSEVCSKPNGEWYLTRDRAIYWVDGRLVRLQIATDITELKKTEVALKDSERRYRAIVQDQTELICRFSAQGQLSFVNAAYCRYFGKSESDLLNTDFVQTIYESDQQAFHKQLTKLSYSFPVCETEHRVILPNNEIRWQHWIERALFDENNKLLEYQAVGRDITERKQTEEELRRAKEAAETATRAKSNFLANMSHEIRTPMNGIVGITELLLNTSLTTQQREYAEIIRRSADTLQTLINDILDFSKIEAGKLTLEPIAFDLESAIFEVARLLAITAESKGLELSVRYAPTAPRHLIGDVGRIRQILTNLVGNAIKFTQKGYVRIDVECEMQEPLLANIGIHVKDSGIGIPEEQLGKIFEKFTQADSSMTRRFGGTGLGLSISQQLVHMMNGKISVSSKQGQGSTFSMKLPLQLAETHLIPHNNLLPQSSEKIPIDARVLIVDDNPINQQILIEQLQTMNVQCVAVNSGEAAIQVLEEAFQQGKPFWLAILDYFMPEMDGEYLGFLIKQSPTIKETMLVMLSSAGAQQNGQNLQAQGFAAHFIKPLPMQQLYDTLLTLWESHSRRKPVAFITLESLMRFSMTPKKVVIPIRCYDNLPVLLAEDNEVNCIVAVNMLQQLGCKVSVARNGREALEQMSRQNFALIFMDVQMPEMSGFEATRAIRQQESLAKRQHRIIVAMTANAMIGDAERCIAEGMDDYIAKPVSLERLNNVLNKYHSPTASSSQTDDSSSNPTKNINMLPSAKTQKVLLVEDNSINRLVATNMLKTFGCRVDIAENGKEAVEQCRQGKYAIVFMDIQMPVMDGIEATRQIRQHCPNNHNHPIIALTANVMPTELAQYRAVGMDDCLAKPITVDRLRNIIKRYLDISDTGIDVIAPEESTTTVTPNKTSNMQYPQEFVEFETFDLEQIKRVSLHNKMIL
ncbi:MAG: hypothetical protein RLZZ262_2222, partial [Bacteroidota bacterium]